jgi:23S rRNA pseudouridine2605 synthase
MRNFERKSGRPAGPAKRTAADGAPKKKYGQGTRSRSVNEGERFGRDGERSAGKRPGASSFKERSAGEKSFGRKRTGERSFGENTTGTKTFGERSFKERSAGEKSFGRKRTGERSLGEKTTGTKTFGERSFKERPKGEKPAGRRTAGVRSYDDNTTNERPFRDRVNKVKSYGEKSYGEKSERVRPIRNKPTGIKVLKTKKSRVLKSSASKEGDGVRLNKFIANSGICSRREADNYITAGLVSVNGEVVTTLGTKINPGDDIRFNGERLKGEKKVYIVMNKPKDFVTTTSDPHAEKTVMDLVRGRCPERVFPVGRLDKATTGVLLITNDGELAEKLTHPGQEQKKIYHVFLDKNLKSSDFNAILDGVTLEDGEIHADALSFIDEEKSQVGLEIHSGRNRIVRRIFEHLGYRVKKLDRVYFAGLTKKNLKRGQWRFLNEDEINFLKMGSSE